MRNVIAFICLFAVADALVADTGSVSITAAEWSLPRSGDVLIQHPGLRTLVQGYLADPGASRLRIRYPGGDEGSLWASELQGWLVGLGIASDSIELVPGSQQADQLQLTLQTTSAHTKADKESTP